MDFYQKYSLLTTLCLPINKNIMWIKLATLAWDHITETQSSGQKMRFTFFFMNTEQRRCSRVEKKYKWLVGCWLAEYMLEAFLNYEIYNNKTYFIAYGLQTFSVWNNYLDFSSIFFLYWVLCMVWIFTFCKFALGLYKLRAHSRYICY